MSALDPKVLQAQYHVHLVQLAMTVVAHQQYCVQQGNIPNMVLAPVSHAQEGSFALIHHSCPRLVSLKCCVYDIVMEESVTYVLLASND